MTVEERERERGKGADCRGLRKIQELSINSPNDRLREAQESRLNTMGGVGRSSKKHNFDEMKCDCGRQRCERRFTNKLINAQGRFSGTSIA